MVPVKVDTQCLHRWSVKLHPCKRKLLEQAVLRDGLHYLHGMRLLNLNAFKSNLLHLHWNLSVEDLLEPFMGLGTIRAVTANVLNALEAVNVFVDTL